MHAPKSGNTHNEPHHLLDHGERAVSKQQRGMMIVMLVLLGSLLALPALAKPSNKWRLELNHKAQVAGEIELSFVTGDAAPVNVVVTIPAKTRENNAAHLVMDAIRAKFGKSLYKTEIDDGEDVLVKKKSGPDFEIVLVRNTAEGLKITLDRE